MNGMDSVKRLLDALEMYLEREKMVVGDRDEGRTIMNALKVIRIIPVIGNYRLYSSARINESATSLIKKLLLARIKLATIRSRAEHYHTAIRPRILEWRFGLYGSFFCIWSDQLWYQSDPGRGMGSLWCCKGKPRHVMPSG